MDMKDYVMKWNSKNNDEALQYTSGCPGVHIDHDSFGMIRLTDWNSPVMVRVCEYCGRERYILDYCCRGCGHGW
jgi:hypothetical protein